MQNNQSAPWKCRKDVLLLCAYWSVPGICFHFTVAVEGLKGECEPATFPPVVVEQDYVGMYFVETF